MDSERGQKYVGELSQIGVESHVSTHGVPEALFKHVDLKNWPFLTIENGHSQWIHYGARLDGGWGTPETTYFIPDPRVTHLPNGWIGSVRVRSFPILGRVIDFRWKELGFKTTGVGKIIVARLSKDSQIKKPLLDNEWTGDLSIRIDRGNACWTMERDRDFPSKDLWMCYQAIAQHLLEWPTPLVE